MDMNSMIAMGLTFLVTLGGVSVMIGKFLPKILKYVHIVADLTVMVDTLLEAVKPDPATGKIEITKEEVEAVTARFMDIKADIASLKA